MKIAAFLLALALLLLPGCAAQKAEFTVDDCFSWLTAHAAFDETPAELERDVIAWRYGIDDGVEARVMVSGSTAEELCVMKAADEDGAKTVYDLLSSHLTEMKDSYANYQPAEVTRLNAALLRREGNCVVLLVSADKDPASLWDDYLKDQ